MAVPTIPTFGTNGNVPSSSLSQISVVLQYIYDQAINAATVMTQDTDATSGTTTSLTYTNTLTTSGSFTLNFTAPPSGKVLVTVGARMFQSVAGRHVYIAYALSGASTYTQTDDDSAQMFADASVNSELYTQKTTLRTGLVAGGAYTATAQYRTQTSGTASYAGRLLVVQPVS